MTTCRKKSPTLKAEKWDASDAEQARRLGVKPYDNLRGEKRGRITWGERTVLDFANGDWIISGLDGIVAVRSPEQFAAEYDWVD